MTVRPKLYGEWVGTAIALTVMTGIMMALVSPVLVPRGLQLYSAWLAHRSGVYVEATLDERRKASRTGHSRSGGSFRVNEYLLRGHFTATTPEGRTLRVTVNQEVWASVYEEAQGRTTFTVAYPPGAPQQAVILGNELYPLGSAVALSLIGLSPVLLFALFHVNILLERRRFVRGSDDS
jgi:hypothetical protein